MQIQCGKKPISQSFYNKYHKEHFSKFQIKYHKNGFTCHGRCNELIELRDV